MLKSLVVQSISRHTKQDAVTSTEPLGLDRMRPREVRPTAGGWALLTVAVTLLAGSLVAAVGLTVRASDDRERVRAFREQRAETTGTVTRKWERRGEDPPRWIAYSFNADGRTYSGEARLSRPRWNSIDVGSSVPVTFARSNPAGNYVFGREPQAMPQLVPYVVSLGLIAGGMALMVAFNREKRLLVEGRAALAVVTGQKKDTSHGGKLAEYEFRLLSGTKMKGHMPATRKPAAAGTHVWVIYAADNPRRNARYPLSLVRLAHEASLRGRQPVLRAR